MDAYSDAHEREQAEAALNESVTKLRRLGCACMVAVMTDRGHVYRQMSAPTGAKQVHLMHIISTKINLELGQLAASAADLVDADNGPTYLDDHRRMVDGEYFDGDLEDKE